MGCGFTHLAEDAIHDAVGLRVQGCGFTHLAEKMLSTMRWCLGFRVEGVFTWLKMRATIR